MAASVSDKLHDWAIANGINLERIKGRFVRDELLPVVLNMESDIREALLRTKVPNAKKLSTRLERLERLRDQINEIILANVGQGKAVHQTMLDQLARDQAAVTLEALAVSIGANLDFIPLNSQDLKRVARGKIMPERVTVTAWWNKMGRDTQRRITGAIEQGFVQGESIDQVTARVLGTRAFGFRDGLTTTFRRNAEAVARTSVQALSNEVRTEVYRENLDVIKGIAWSATLDSRTSTTCLGLHQLTWTITEDGQYIPDGHGIAYPGPTAHWNCFTEDTPVMSPSNVKRSYRRPYSGELLTIETDSGRRITATPNHPVLTDVGWIPIGRLEKGHNLICKKGCGRKVSFAGPKNQHGESSFFEFNKAFSKLPGVISVEMPVSAPDFHGDGTNDEIGQVWTDSSLCDEFNSPVPKFGCQGIFEIAYLYVSELLSGFSRLYQSASFGGFSPSCVMGGLDAGFLAPSPAGVQIFGPGPGYPCLYAPTAKRGECNADFFGNITGGHLVGNVEVDRVRMIRSSKAVSVFVHNLETETGWYLASGIISHNCRSTQVPITKSWEELTGREITTKEGGKADVNNLYRQRLIDAGAEPERAAKSIPNARASMDGEVFKDITFDAWLKSKGKTFTARMIGKGKADLFFEGKITTRDLISSTAKPFTLEQLKERLQ